MRLAVVVAPTYERSPKLHAASAVRDGEHIAERLARPDAGFVVRQVRADGQLEDRLDELFGSERIEALVVYLGCRAEAREEGTVTLGLDDGEEVDLGRLRERVASAAPAVLLLMDLLHNPDPDALAPSASLIAEVREVLRVRGTGLNAVVTARPLDRSHLMSAFAALLVDAVESLASRDRPVLADHVYAAMREQDDRFHRLPAIAYFRGNTDFALLVSASDTAQPIAPSPPARRTQSSAPPPSSDGGPKRWAALAPPIATTSAPEAPEQPSQPSSADELIATGDDHFALERWQAAISDYKRALLLLGAKRTGAHLELYLKLGAAYSAAGDAVRARSNYDKVLAIDPLNEQAFAAVSSELRVENDWSGLDRILMRRFELLKDRDEKCETLRAIARIWLEGARDQRRGADVLERLLLLLPNDPEALERMAVVQYDLGRHAAAISAQRRLATVIAASDPARAARILTEAARSAAEHLLDKHEAVELAEQALSTDPLVAGALDVAIEVLTKQRRFRQLAELYEWQIDRTTDVEQKTSIARAAGLLHRDELDDVDGALHYFERALEHHPGDQELRYAAAELYEASGDRATAVSQYRALAPYAPRNVDVYRRALWLFEKMGETDAAWNATTVLDALGEADINEELLADAHRPDGLLPVRDALDDDTWQSGLFSPGRDAGLARVLGIVTEAAIAAELERLREVAELPELDESSRQDPSSSTTTLSRSLVWTARVLGIEPPRLYVWNEVEGELALAPAEQPVTVASRMLGSGLELPELAFVWGRHLAYYRPEHRLVVYYGTFEQLSALLWAALSLGGCDVEAISLEAEAVSLTERLQSWIDDAQIETLYEAVQAFEPQNLRQRLHGWARSVHDACGRVGLLACGDVRIAAATIRRFPPRGEIDAEQQIDDLFAFAISREYARLRERLGVAVAR